MSGSERFREGMGLTRTPKYPLKGSNISQEVIRGYNKG